MRLADEIRATYATPHYTFEDVIAEIRWHVFETYAEVAKHNFSSWPGFNVVFSKDVPKMKWDYGREVSCTHWLKIPDGSFDFDMMEIGKWFEKQGFEYTTNEYCRCKSWRIKF